MDEQKQDNHLEPTYNSSVPVTGLSMEDLLGAMDEREGWRERVRKIHAGGATWR